MKDWQRTVVSCLRELSDIELQRSSWVAMAGTNLPAPEELVCQLFDDSGLGDLLDVEMVFSLECDAALKELGRLVSDVSTSQPPNSLLQDPGWHAVVAKAREALLKLEETLDATDKHDSH